MRKQNWTVKLLLPTLLLGGLAGSLPATPTCGPGFDWMNTCTSGTDTFPSIAIHIIIDLPGLPPVLAEPLFGNSTVFRGDPVGEPEVIQTEMVSLLLVGASGLTLRAGDGVGNLASDGPLYSPGMITEDPGELTATSFFDVFFELSGGPLGNMVVRNTTAARMQATIDRVPPDWECVTQGLCIYVLENPPVPVVLYDQNDNPIWEGFLIAATHEPIPEPATGFLLVCGLAGLGFLKRTRVFSGRVR